MRNGEVWVCKEVRQRVMLCKECVFDCPHMLFYGHPGTGKPTTALAITHQLFGFASCPLNYLFEIPKSVFISELYKSRVLELNASDDRGSMLFGPRSKILGYPCPPFKIIILDEANALRRTMETHSKVTRFFYMQLYQIIEPLALRCAKFRFKPLSEDIMISRIVHIVQEEGLNLDPEVLSTLSSTSQGDLNRALTFLQVIGASRLFGSSISSKELTSVSGVNIITCFFIFTYQVWCGALLCKINDCLVDVSDEYLQLFDVASSTMRAVCNVQEDFFQEC
ncbi:unnamed protein product [Malus baccata var. baccata]